MARPAAPHRGIDIHYGEAEAVDLRPSKTRLKQTVARAAGAGRGAGRAAGRAARGHRDARATARRDRRVPPHPIARRPAPPDAVRRQADAQRRRRRRCARRWPRRTLGSARETLALHEAERWRAELIADDDALDALARRPTRTPTPQQLRSLVRAARRDAAGLAARGAPAAELPRAVPVHPTPADPEYRAMSDIRSGPHRRGLGQRPRLRRRLRGQGHPGAARTGWAARCATRCSGTNG